MPWRSGCSSHPARTRPTCSGWWSWDGTFRGILHAAYSHGEKELEDCRQFQFGALHLKPEERAELQKIVEDYLRAHGAPQAEAEHWEYVLMAYRADDVKP